MMNIYHLMLRLICKMRSTLCSRVSPFSSFLGRGWPASVGKLYLLAYIDVLNLFEKEVSLAVVSLFRER